MHAKFHSSSISPLALLVALLITSGCAADKAASPTNPIATESGSAAPTPEGDAAKIAVADPFENIPESPPVKAQTRHETITFPAGDGLLITADLHQTQLPSAPFIVLFHQAGWSRGEYKEIAPKLATLGFNCMAVDQRSGGKINGVENATKKAAAAKKLGTKFLDALPDMKAAMEYVKTKYPEAQRIAWGSSYSAALVLVLAGQNKGLVDATLSFSPGEYFVRFGKAKNFVKDEAAKLEIPVFITSAKKEGDKWKSIYETIPSPDKTSFLPNSEGKHGSRALWATQSDANAYWAAVLPFLQSLKK